jgi:hypothetical protein
MEITTHHQESSCTHRLLTGCAFVAILLSLVLPGIASAAGNPAAGPYIIVFKDTVDPAAEAPGLAKAYGLQPGFLYEHALKGMSAVVPAGRLVALQHDPRVAYVVEDMERHISAQTLPTGIRRIFAECGRGGHRHRHRLPAPGSERDRGRQLHRENLQRCMRCWR